jgi:trigger factor
MQVTAEQTDPCTVVLSIEVDEQQVSRAFDSAYRDFGRHANVPGFRPGKAPRALVERFVDTERVRRHALEKIVRDTYPKAIEEESLTPFRDPEIDASDLEDKKSYTYKASVPLEPQITLGEYTGLTIEKPLFNVTDEMVIQRIDALREERGKLDRVTDRGVQAGDMLIVENQIKVEGLEEDETPVRRQLVQMGQNVPGYDEEILGMMPDEERTFELTYPADHEEAEKAGKKATFTVTLKSISAKRLPDLDDDFAMQVAGAETVDEFKELVKTRLEADAIRLSSEIAEQRILEAILENSEVHFPEVLVRDEVRDKLNQLSHQLQTNKMGYEQYLARMGMTVEQHQSQIYTESHEQIRVLLALREISIQEGLQASNEDVDAEFDRMVGEGALTEEQDTEYRADARRRLQVANALIQTRLHDFLFANNTLNEVEQAEAPNPDELAAAGEETETDLAEELTEASAENA